VTRRDAERPVFCGTCGARFFGHGTNCPKCAKAEAERAARALAPHETKPERQDQVR
jgi:hypothetical protein